MDREFRNPSPPPSDEKLMEGENGSLRIDNTAFDHAWLFETLILALQEVEKQELETESQQDVALDQAVEGRMCTLWDFAATRSIAEFMIEHRSPNLVFGLIVRSRSSRLVEICCGILANVTSCVPQFYSELANDTYFVNYIAQLFVGCCETRILIELTRLLRGSFCAPAFVRTFFTALRSESQADAFFEKLVFIMTSSTNVALLVAVADFLYKTLDFALENGAAVNESESEADENVERFAARCCDRRLIDAVREGWSQFVVAGARQDAQGSQPAVDTDAYFVSVAYQFTLREAALASLLPQRDADGSSSVEMDTGAAPQMQDNSSSQLSFFQLLTDCTFVRRPRAVNLSNRRDSATLRMLIVTLRCLLTASFDFQVQCASNLNRCARVMHALLVHHVAALCVTSVDTQQTASQSESYAAECLADIGALVTYIFTLDLDSLVNRDRFVTDHFLTAFYRCVAPGKADDEDEDEVCVGVSKLERIVASLKQLDSVVQSVPDADCEVESESTGCVSQLVAARIERFINDSVVKSSAQFELFDQLLKMLR